MKPNALRLELTAAQKGGFTNDGALLDRTAAIENELQRLTGQTEELAYRISAIVRGCDPENCQCLRRASAPWNRAVW